MGVRYPPLHVVAGVPRLFAQLPGSDGRCPTPRDPAPGVGRGCNGAVPSGSADEDGSGKDWEIILAPYALFANVTGDTSVGQAGAVNVDFGDILEAGAMGHAEARVGHWGRLFDFAYMKLADDIGSPRGRVVDAEVEEL